MKTEAQITIIAQASEAIASAALESITAIITAKASLTIVIREQVKLLEKAGISQKEIAAIVKAAIGDAASPSHISRTLTACGVRLRGKRTDAGFLRMADAALDAAAESKPAAAADGEEDGEGDDSGDDSGDESETAGSGHTAETLAALLASLDPAMVEQALEIAGLMDFMHG
jgi:hypothetical protein